MPEIGTSSSMSGDGKRSVGHWPQTTAPVLDSTISEVAARLGEVSSLVHSGLDFLTVSFRILTRLRHRTH